MSEARYLLAIANGENQRVEFKERLDRRKPHKICEEVAAFASSGGGTIFVGVKDDKSIVGIEDAEIAHVVSKVENTIAEKVSPAPQWSAGMAKLQGKTVLVIVVEASEHPIHYYDGRPYHRVGTASRPASSSEVTSRHMQFAIRDEFRRIADTATASYIYGQGELATMDYSELVKRLTSDFPALLSR